MESSSYKFDAVGYLSRLIGIPSEECTYYCVLDIACCPQHQDVKKLANKIYNRWWATCIKISDLGCSEQWDVKKHDGLSTKRDKLWQEFLNIERGLDKCCGHKLYSQATGTLHDSNRGNGAELHSHTTGHDHIQS